MTSLDSLYIPIYEGVNDNPIEPEETTNLNVGYLCQKYNDVIDSLLDEIAKLESTIYYLENYLPAAKTQRGFDAEEGITEYLDFMNLYRIGNFTRYSITNTTDFDNYSLYLNGEQLYIESFQDIPNGKMFFISPQQILEDTYLELRLNTPSTDTNILFAFYTE